MICNVVHFCGCSYPNKVSNHSPWSRHHETLIPALLKPRELRGGKLLADNLSVWSISWRARLTCPMAVGLPCCYLLLPRVVQAGELISYRVSLQRGKRGCGMYTVYRQQDRRTIN